MWTDMTARDAQIGENTAAAGTVRFHERRDLVIGLTPFGAPDAPLVAAVTRAGALGVLDLGGPRGRARAELARAASWTPGPFGVRATRACQLVPGDLAPLGGRIDTLVLGADLADTDLTDDGHATWQVAELAPRY